MLHTQVKLMEVMSPSPQYCGREKGDNATIHCSHTKGDYYYQIYWYRQLPGERVKLTVHTELGREDHDFGDYSTQKFSATKPDAHSGTLTVKNLVPEDKGLYFCAVCQGPQWHSYIAILLKNPCNRASLNPVLDVNIVQHCKTSVGEIFFKHHDKLIFLPTAN